MTLERAASMGGVFWLGGLLAIGRLETPTPHIWASGETKDLAQLRAVLKELTERDYVLRLPDSTFSGDEEYVFKHNLEREQLLKLVPGAQQRKNNEAIAEWLAFRENVRTHEEYLGMLARHQEQANLRSKAAASYLEAADLARAHYANAKAAEYYEKGLSLVRDGAEVGTEVYLSALHHYGDVLQVLGKNGDALLAFREMLARAYRLDLRSKGGAAHSRIGRLYRETGRLADATAHLEAALKLFEEAGDERGIASATDDIGKLHWLRGDYPRALEFTQKGLIMRRLIGDRRSIALSLNNLGLVYQDSGQFKQALEAFEQALLIRREIGDLGGVSATLNNLGTVAQDQREDRRALELFDEAYEVAKETGDRNRIALVLTNLGETHNRLGDAPKAIQFLKEAEQLADELGDKLGLAEAVRGLGKAYLARREYTKARECTARAVQLFTEVQSKVQLGVALRSLGEVVSAGSARGGEELKAARGHLLRSIAIFEEIGNEVELARSCRSYAETLKHAVDLSQDAPLAREAASFAKRADEIFAKLRSSSSQGPRAGPRSSRVDGASAPRAAHASGALARRNGAFQSKTSRHGARRSIRGGRHSVATCSSGYVDAPSPSSSLVTRTREGSVERRPTARRTSPRVSTVTPTVPGASSKKRALVPPNAATPGGELLDERDELRSRRRDRPSRVGVGRRAGRDEGEEHGADRARAGGGRRREAEGASQGNDDRQCVTRLLVEVLAERDPREVRHGDDEERAHADRLWRHAREAEPSERGREEHRSRSRADRAGPSCRARRRRRRARATRLAARRAR